MSQNYSTRLAVVAGVLLLALVAVFWPSVVSPGGVAFNSAVPWADKFNLRAGIDIKGGTSLLYEIKAPEGSTVNPNLAQDTVKALKQRIDPNGVMNLVWRPQGNTRIEIQMPLSSATGETLQRQKELAQARDQLAATNIRVPDAVDAVEGKNGKTPAELDKLAAGDPERKKAVDDMKAAWAAMQDARAKGDVAAGSAAQERYTKAQQDLAATNLPPATVDEKYGLRNAQTRTAQLDALQARWKNFPARAQALATWRTAKDRLNVIARTGGALESAEDLKRLLRGSGVLEFHILPANNDPDLGTDGYRGWVERLQKEGPILHQGDRFKWFEVENPDEFKGQAVPWNDRSYVLASIRREDSLDRNSNDRDGTPWALKAAYPTSDSSGVNVVGFEFNSVGATKFGNLTTAHQGRPMAIMLDGRVISAPNINSPITGGSGIITGGGSGFTTGEMNYLIRMLSAGSLPAQLNDQPISERTVGPQLGEDNLRAGMLACGLGLAVVAVFLIGYYYLAGVVAFGAILMNIVLILGSMAAIHATFTLPGIAAIVLTIGTAVDANVLVFERLREEQHRGLGLRMAMRNAYDRAFSAIVDSNMTTVITSVFLILFGTEEVKGFGITLIIGIVCSLFTALFVTRTVFGILIDHFGVRQLGSVPLSFPKWDKLLKPNIDWMGLAWIFYAFSAVLIVSGLALFFHYVRAGQMMDIEFASGTAVTFELKQPQKQETVRGWIEGESRRRATSGADVLPSPSVVRVGPEGTTWEVTTPNPDARSVRAAVIAAVGGNLKAEIPSVFQSQGADVKAAMAVEDPARAVILPLTGDNLNSPANWPGRTAVPPEAKKYPGGVAIVLRGLSPPLSPAEIDARVKRQSLQSLTPAQAGGEPSGGTHEYTVVAADGSPPDRPTDTAILLTADPNIPFDNGKATDKEKDDQKALWRDNLVGPMWALVNDAVARPAELQQVKNFDASVAGDTQRDALVALTLSIIAIMAYIWIRFGNLKYGTATVVALLHDVLFTVAALGFSHLLANNVFGDLLKLEAFRINLTVVAGILTIMGYSMIDTIVVFDRIRENRGKYGHVSRQIINDAVNQTLSRTLLTAGTTIIMVCIMYFLGGAGIHGFTFVLLVGILVGTYSSVAIAAPILLLGNEATRDVPDAARESAGLRPIGARTSTTT